MKTVPEKNVSQEFTNN